MVNINVNVIEQSINHFKMSFCLAGRKTQNTQTLYDDLPLSGITQLITVLLVDKIHQLCAFILMVFLAIDFPG